MYYHSNIYIEFNIFKLWRYWWTARKYFLAPIIVKYKLEVNQGLGSDYFYMKTDNYNKWFHLSFHSCDWKSKFEEVRFEGVPYACLILFNKVKYINCNLYFAILIYVMNILFFKMYSLIFLNYLSLNSDANIENIL